MHCSKMHTSILDHVPPLFRNYIDQLLTDLSESCAVRLSRPRRTKFGDFRPSLRKGSHAITINNDLNEWAFLITLLHEVAHSHNWDMFGRKVAPHGAEWKSLFSDLLDPLLEESALPSNLRVALIKYQSNPRASSCSDPSLYKTLRSFDTKSSLMLSELTEGTLFKLSGKGIFMKGIKRRTRFQCKNIENGREYYINGIATVELLHE